MAGYLRTRRRLSFYSQLLSKVGSCPTLEAQTENRGDISAPSAESEIKNQTQCCLELVLGLAASNITLSDSRHALQVLPAGGSE